MTPPAKQGRLDLDVIINRNMRFPLHLLGIDVLEADYRPDCCLLFISFLVGLFMCVCLITIAIGDSDTAMQVVTYLAICMQGPVKLYTGVQYRAKYNELLEFCRNMYRIVERSGSASLQRGCGTFSLWFCRIVNTQCVVCMGAGILQLVFPAVAYVVLGMNYVPVLPLSLPFVDTKDGIGYVMDSVFGAVGVITGTCGIIPSDVGFLVLVLHSYLMSIVLEHEVIELNGELRDWDAKYGNGAQTSAKSAAMAKCVRRYRKIIDRHCEYYFYTQKVADLYFYISTVEVYTDGLGLCSLIYIIITLNDVVAYMLFLAMFGKLMLFSSLGMVMEISNDKVYAALQAIDYYRLPNKHMKDMIFMSRMSKNAVYLKAGNANLDMSIFVEIMKTVYTIAMMLVQVDEI